MEEIIPQLLPHGRAELSTVARQLGMSSRTLSRKLREEGVTYAEILDRLRSALAKRYLSDRELPVTQIAWLLGYQEVSSFTHAFKRWTGTTPREFRLSNCVPARGAPVALETLGEADDERQGGNQGMGRPDH